MYPGAAPVYAAKVYVKFEPETRNFCDPNSRPKVLMQVFKKIILFLENAWKSESEKVCTYMTQRQWENGKDYCVRKEAEATLEKERDKLRERENVFIVKFDTWTTINLESRILKPLKAQFISANKRTRKTDKNNQSHCRLEGICGA